MATHNLPYPLSDNRSYIAAHSSRLPADALYDHDDVQYRANATYKQQEYRFYTSPPRQATSIVPPHGVLEGIPDIQSGYDPRLQVGGSSYSGSVAGEYAFSSCFAMAYSMCNGSSTSLRAELFTDQHPPFHSASGATPLRCCVVSCGSSVRTIPSVFTIGILPFPS